MNLRLDIVINDITGVSWKAIILAILNGERNPNVLASLADARIKKSKEQIARMHCMLIFNLNFFMN